MAGCVDQFPGYIKKQDALFGTLLAATTDVSRIATQACSRAPGRCGCCTLPRARKAPGPRARSRRRSSAWSTSQPTAAPEVSLSPPRLLFKFRKCHSVHRTRFSWSCSCSKGKQALPVYWFLFNDCRFVKDTRFPDHAAAAGMAMMSSFVSCPLMDLLLKCADSVQGQALPVAPGWCSCRWGRRGRQLAPPQRHISPGRRSCRRGTWPARRGNPGRAPSCTARRRGAPHIHPSLQASSLSLGSPTTQVILKLTLCLIFHLVTPMHMALVRCCT